MMPPHRVYIEPFLGGGAIARLKRPAPMNIAMDLYAPAVENFRKLLASPPSRDLTASAESARNDDSAGCLVTIADTTRLSDARSPLAGTDERRRRTPSLTAMRPAATAIWTVLQRDALEFLETSPDLTGSDTVVYCDPPYLHSTRSTKTVVKGWKARQTSEGWNGLYQHEMSDVDHRRLLRWAIAAECRVMISGYWSKMYGSTLRNWRCSRFQAMTRGGMAEECVWCNFPEPAELHDYRYLGEGFRERERIKRKKQRWTARLAKMPLLERRCLLAALEETP